MSEYLNIVIDDPDHELSIETLEDYYELWGILKLAWVQLAPLHPDKVVWTTYCVEDHGTK